MGAILSPISSAAVLKSSACTLLAAGPPPLLSAAAPPQFTLNRPKPNHPDIPGIVRLAKQSTPHLASACSSVFGPVKELVVTGRRLARHTHGTRLQVYDPRQNMAHALLQSTCLPSSVSWAKNKQFVGYNRTRKAPTMLCSSRLTPMRIQSFIGLRGVNALDVMFQKSGPSLQSKLKNATTLTKQRRKQRMAPPRAMFERFTEKAIKVIMLSQDEARRLGHNFVGTEQILLGLIGEGTGIAAKVLKSTGITLKEARVEVEKIIGRGSGFVPVEIPFTPRAKRVLELSLEEARQLGNNYIGSEHLLLGLLREGEGVAARVLENLGADLSNIRAQVIRMVGESAETIGAGVGGGSSGSKMPTLEERTKNNPCLIGEPGVGKTAIAEGLAQRIANGDVPETIEGKKVITLDMGLLVAGTKYRGEFEERLKKLMEEIKQSDDIILFIDEVHTLIGAGAAEGAIDAANILKPALARGELQCIGATTLDEYRKHIEKDPALERRFQPVKVPEPTVEEAIQILRGLRERYEIHHKVRYTDEAIDAAAQLSHQYISDRFLPDKAIDLIDEAGSRVRLHHAQLPEEAKELERELRQITKEKNEAVRSQDFEKAGELRDKEMDLRSQMSALVNKKKETTRAEAETGDGGPTVTDADIHRIVSSWTGIPVDKVTSEESSRLLRMESTLHGRVIGQDEAVEAISRAIRRARVGLKNPNRPIASFIFSGPTGVGKSELAKALAAYYFGSEDAMVRLDMSEFMERHTVSKLIGSPPGYVGYSEGGQLTEAVRRRPYTLILFDEIEKAHPDVFNMMLQILEDGRLTDSKGRTVDFKNTLLIMTSNIGSSVILQNQNRKPKRRFGFQLDYDEDEEEEKEDRSYNNIKRLVIGELKEYFRPEFLNRLDDMIVFRQLTKEEVKEIGDIMLKEVVVRLKKRDIELQVTDRFRDLVVEEGYSPSYGARPLRRAIMRLLEDSMAEKMLAREIKEGDSVIVDVDSDGKIVVLGGGGGGRGAAALEASPDLAVV
ncbi:Chaperone protein ClpC1- chloroplastic [Striga hermonthica]|uniref:Chaperone protein ClpC1- chloroplastic n=1 Tax=Striga hermonthica TaxID=68872 RepID=A0A9N7MU65_STRHE|nr:Chaperone protein ClpC1- chloroplastic [Striga hermonthica]